MTSTASTLDEIVAAIVLASYYDEREDADAHFQEKIGRNYIVPVIAKDRFDFFSRKEVNMVLEEVRVEPAEHYGNLLFM